MAEPVSVLVVDDSAARVDAIRAALGELFEVVSATSENQAFHLAKKREFDTLCTAHRLPDIDGITLLGRVQEAYAWQSGVVLVAPGDYAAMQALAGNVRCLALLTPWTGERLRELVTRAAHLGRMKQTLLTTKREVAALPSRKT